MSDLAFDLDCVLELDTADELLDHLRFAFAGFEWPAVIGMASPMPATPKLKKSPETDLQALLAKVPQLCKDPASVRIGFGRLSRLTWGQRPDRSTFFFSFALAPDDNVFRDPASCVRGLTHVARRLLERGVRMTGAVERVGEGQECLPFVPLAKTRRPLVITTIDEVYAAYDLPDEFWSAGWKVEDLGDRRLLTRCQDVVDKAGVLAAIQDYQWQMARAAKPKLTKYGDPKPTDEEREIYEYGDAEPRCQPVGLHSATGMAEFTCALDTGEHIYGFEVYAMRWMVKHEQTQDGQPITGVRVVFLEDWQAHSEKRPLLDNGVEVWVQDVERGDRQITE